MAAGEKSRFGSIINSALPGNPKIKFMILSCLSLDQMVRDGCMARWTYHCYYFLEFIIKFRENINQKPHILIVGQ